MIPHDRYNEFIRAYANSEAAKASRDNFDADGLPALQYIRSLPPFTSETLDDPAFDPSRFRPFREPAKAVWRSQMSKRPEHKIDQLAIELCLESTWAMYTSGAPQALISEVAADIDSPESFYEQAFHTSTPITEAYQSGDPEARKIVAINAVKTSGDIITMATSRVLANAMNSINAMNRSWLSVVGCYGCPIRDTSIPEMSDPVLAQTVPVYAVSVAPDSAFAPMLCDVCRGHGGEENTPVRDIHSHVVIIPTTLPLMAILRGSKREELFGLVDSVEIVPFGFDAPDAPIPAGRICPSIFPLASLMLSPLVSQSEVAAKYATTLLSRLLLVIDQDATDRGFTPQGDKA